MSDEPTNEDPHMPDPDMPPARRPQIEEFPIESGDTRPRPGDGKQPEQDPEFETYTQQDEDAGEDTPEEVEGE